MYTFFIYIHICIHLFPSFKSHRMPLISINDFSSQIEFWSFWGGTWMMCLKITLSKRDSSGSNFYKTPSFTSCPGSASRIKIFFVHKNDKSISRDPHQIVIKFFVYKPI